jgi:hypothetical protein
MIPECRRLQNILDDNALLIARDSFGYLNSTLNNDRVRITNFLIEQILTIIGKDELSRIRQLEKDVVEKREIEMLTNIYNYSKEHQYNEALFFIGSGHRESILMKIGEFNAKQETKLNWAIRDNNDYFPPSKIREK